MRRPAMEVFLNVWVIGSGVVGILALVAALVPPTNKHKKIYFGITAVFLLTSFATALWQSGKAAASEIVPLAGTGIEPSPASGQPVKIISVPGVQFAPALSARDSLRRAGYTVAVMPRTDSNENPPANQTRYFVARNAPIALAVA